MNVPSEMISFNKSYYHSKMVELISNILVTGNTGGNGIYTKQCQSFMEEYYKFSKVLLTPNCTQALELVSILIDIKPGDEVIVPSYTFVSTANAFVMRGAKIILVDSLPDHPNMDHTLLSSLITSKTKAIVPVHYAGVACDMISIMELVKFYQNEKHQTIYVIEDAAQAIDSYYSGRPLGSWGHFGCISFHATKNISSGEGGALVINDISFIKRAEIIREKGTNRVDFLCGRVSKYNWIDIGSSYLPSDITAACLLPQFEKLAEIKSVRKEQWDRYYSGLLSLSIKNKLIELPSNTQNVIDSNYHIFYIVCKNVGQRDDLIEYLKSHYIQVNRHYVSLHLSDYYNDNYDNINKSQYPNADKYNDLLIRLPLYYDFIYVDWVIYLIYKFFDIQPDFHFPNLVLN